MSQRNAIEVLDLRTDRTSAGPYLGREPLAVSSSGQLLATTGEGGGLRLWNLVSGELIAIKGKVPQISAATDQLIFRSSAAKHRRVRASTISGSREIGVSASASLRHQHPVDEVAVEHRKGAIDVDVENSDRN